jgi:hypothetical protein
MIVEGAPVLNRLLNSTGKKLRLYVADSVPGAKPARTAIPTRPSAAASTPKLHDVQRAHGGDALVSALAYAAECSDPAQGLAALEAAGLSPQRAAAMGGITLTAYEALRTAAPDAPEWSAFRKSVAEWRVRLNHS